MTFTKPYMLNTVDNTQTQAVNKSSREHLRK